MDKQQPGQPQKEPELKRPEEAVEDLEPEPDQAEAIKGGDGAVNCGSAMSKV